MPFIIIMRHGRLLRWWKRRPKENYAVFDLYAALRIRCIGADKEIEMFTAPEMEAIRAGQIISDYLSLEDPPVSISASIVPCLRETGKLPISTGLVDQLLGARRTKIVMTHRRRIAPLGAAISRRRGQPLLWIRPPNPRNPGRDQALVINIQTLETEIFQPADLAAITRARQ